MAKEVTFFQSDNGNAFPTAYEAWKDDLTEWFLHHGCENMAIARKIVKAIDDGQPDTLESLRRIVEGLTDTAPPPPPITVEAPAELEPDPPVTDKIGTPARPLWRCSGINCSHQPGTCTATADQD